MTSDEHQALIEAAWRNAVHVSDQLRVAGQVLRLYSDRATRETVERVASRLQRTVYALCLTAILVALIAKGV
jgi:hypothetical protein